MNVFLKVLSIMVCGLLLAACSKTSPGEQSKIPGSSPAVPAFELTDIEASWTRTASGFSPLEGMLWVPQVKMTVNNTGTHELDLYVKAIFLDTEGTITDDTWEPVIGIPAGYKKGPVFLRGSIGYKDDSIFWLMMDEEAKKWHVDILVSKNINGPWEKFRSLPVELPEEYRLK